MSKELDKVLSSWEAYAFSTNLDERNYDLCKAITEITQAAANKAEVETIDTPEFRELLAAFKNSCLGFDYNETVENLVAHINGRFATPPATTGASTACTGNPIYQVNAAGASGSWRNVNKAQYDLAADTCRRIVIEQVSASTVLTDERIPVLRIMRIAEECDIHTLDDRRTVSFGRAIEREVAAQAGQVAVPEGWKLVPIEPTQAMNSAGYMKNLELGSAKRNPGDTYKAMLAAAPSPAKESK